MLMKLSLLDGQLLKRVLQGPTPLTPPQGSPSGLPGSESAALCLLCQSCEHHSISVNPRMPIDGCHSLSTFILSSLGQELGLVQLSVPRAQGKAYNWERLKEWPNGMIDTD